MHRALGNEVYEYACAIVEQDDVDFQVITAREHLEMMGGSISEESFSSLKVRGEYGVMFEKLRSKFSVETIPFPADKKIIDIGDYYGDFSRLHAACGWRPEFDLEQGLARTIAFYREHKEVYWG